MQESEDAVQGAVHNRTLAGGNDVDPAAVGGREFLFVSMRLS
jgi:hypothetical protein